MDCGFSDNIKFEEEIGIKGMNVEASLLVSTTEVDISHRNKQVVLIITQ
jgi:hypothetical protein